MSGLGHEVSVEGFFSVVSAELAQARREWSEHAGILSRHTEAALLCDVDIALRGLGRVSATELTELQNIMGSGDAHSELTTLRARYEQLHLLADSAQCECRCGLDSLRAMLRNVVEPPTGPKSMPVPSAKDSARNPRASYCTTYFF